jgi:hypothetical protein
MIVVLGSSPRKQRQWTLKGWPYNLHKFSCHSHPWDTSTRRDGSEYGGIESMSEYARNCPRVGSRTSHCPFNPTGWSPLYPYHYSRVQGLTPHDYHHRPQYCERLLREHESAGFLKCILWSDEVAFTREGVYNSHNGHLWTQHNPHVTREWGHQVRWSINVWAGIIGNCVVGPYYYSTASMALLIVSSCRKCYQCCLKICHWRFYVTCGFNTMGRRRILAHRHNSTSTHSFLTWRLCIMACEIAGPEPSQDFIMEEKSWLGLCLCVYSRNNECYSCLSEG